jgi:starvation-inducible DNA-binding protein
MATNGKKSGAATAAAGRTFSTSNDLEADVREKSVALLNQQLADSLDLFSQLKQAHWNVKGKDFYQLHLLFDEFAAHAEEWIDEIAERATALGGYATGTVRMSAAATTLPEYPTDVTEGMDHTRCVVERLAAYAASTREAIDQTDEWGDASTADLFTEISREVDKDLWFAEAHLQA